MNVRSEKRIASFRRDLIGLSVAASSILLSGCATPAADRRADQWRGILEAEAPVGASAKSVEQALEKRGISHSRGTYVTVGDDGVTRSDCPDPQAAVTGRERAGKVGFNSNVIEITACLGPDGRVISHHVGIWIY